MKNQIKLFLLMAATAAFSQVTSDTISFVNFENRPVGVYTKAYAQDDFKRNNYDNSFWYAVEQSYNAGNAQVLYDGAEHGNVLQLKYPKGCVGPMGDNAPACAIQIIQPLERTADTMWNAYDIFFEDGFEFRLGGKLPGLCGGKCYTGNAMPSTGDGWSARIMWRENGNAVQLLYFMGQVSVYGDDAKWNLNGTIPQAQFTTGKWHRIVNKVTMNTITTPGQGDKNGRVQTWYDGQLVMDVDTLRFRDYDSVRVDKFYLSTFHGGSGSDWAPTHDCFIRYDNFTISTDSIPVTTNASNSENPNPIWSSHPEKSVEKIYIYRINGSKIGQRNERPDAHTHKLKNGKNVKVVR
jgi:hypothetical protein